jgi:hypothetical protein
MKIKDNKTENPPPLVHFKYRRDYMRDSKTWPSVELQDIHAGYGMAFIVEPDNIVIRTSRRGGHGDGGFEDKGRSCNEWADLLLEAKLNQEHYFPKA